MSSSAPSVADADRAGGQQEVVYDSSSSSSPAVVIPAVTVPVSVLEPDASNISREGISAEQAFELFSGKLYFPPPGPGISAASPVVHSETPLQRLSRLSRELTELEQDLKPLSAQDVETETNLQSTVEALRSRLEQASASWPKYDSTQLESLLQQSQQSDVSTPNTGVQQLPSSSAPWEARLQRLEQMVEVSSSSGDSPSLNERLQKLEQLATTLDPTTLNQLSNKAKILRQDLEAANKARTKLLQQGSGSSSSTADQVQLQQLYEAHLQIQPMIPHLPAVVQRLHGLAQLHATLSRQAQQLQACETTLQQLQTSAVPALQQSVQELEGGWQTNVAQLRENVSALEQRLKQSSPRK
jgi:Dynamitin